MVAASRSQAGSGSISPTRRSAGSWWRGRPATAPRVSATVHLPPAHARRDRGAPHRGACEDAAHPRPVLRRVGGSARWLVRGRLLSTGLQRGGLRRRQATTGSPGDIPLLDHDEIAIVIGAPPAQIPARYAFGPNEP